MLWTEVAASRLVFRCKLTGIVVKLTQQQFVISASMDIGYISATDVEEF